MGACLSKSSQVKIPCVVSILAVSGPEPASPLVASSIVKFPLAGSSPSARAMGAPHPVEGRLEVDPPRVTGRGPQRRPEISHLGQPARQRSDGEGPRIEPV